MAIFSVFLNRPESEVHAPRPTLAFQQPASLASNPDHLVNSNERPESLSGSPACGGCPSADSIEATRGLRFLPFRPSPRPRHRAIYFAEPIVTMRSASAGVRPILTRACGNRKLRITGVLARSKPLNGYGSCEGAAGIK